MRTIYVSILLFLSLSSIAQKVDLDKFSFVAHYQLLPQEPVKYEDRTFGVKVVVGNTLKAYQDEAQVYERINIDGWKKVEDKPMVGVKIQLQDFTFDSHQLITVKDEIKDKDGKVTGTKVSYYVVSYYKGFGKGVINGPVTVQEKPKVEEVKKEEPAKPVNRFMTNVVINKDLAKKEEAEEGQVFNFTTTIDKRTQTYSNSESAYDEYKRNERSNYDNTLRGFMNQSIGTINNTLASRYGFIPWEFRDFLWILDSKSHPEYPIQQEAIQAIKQIFKESAADMTYEQYKENFTPLVEYFESLKTKYAKDEKGDKKMRYSAYYNLSKLYYYLDQPDKALAEAEGLIKNDYDENDAVGLKKSAQTLMDDLKRAKVESRHNPKLK